MYYQTAFPLTESVISEGGSWINGLATGLDWQDVKTTPAKAFGDNTTPSGYSDPTAILTGSWQATQTVETVLFNTSPTANVREFEIRLRSLITAHVNRGYECLFNDKGNFQVVRWNGAISDFTPLDTTITGAYSGLVTGDVLKAVISGSTITGYLNGVEMGNATDTTWTDGNPGMGFFSRDDATTLFGFSSLVAYDPVGQQPRKLIYSIG